MNQAESFLQLLEAQDVYYHDTDRIEEILRQNQFVLTNGMLRGSEHGFDQGGKNPFFLSLSRVPVNRYRGLSSCTLVLDGQALSQRYRIKSMEYWGAQMGRVTGSSEAEDRLFSHEPVIPNAKKYIKEVHVYVSEKEMEDPSKGPKLQDLAWLTADLPTFVYSNRKAMFLLDKRRAVDFDLSDLPSSNMSGVDERAVRYKEIIDFLETGADGTHNWRRLLKDPSNYGGAIQADLHNAMRQKDLFSVEQHSRLAKLIQKEGASNMKAFLISRFKKLSGWDDLPDTSFRF